MNIPLTLPDGNQAHRVAIGLPTLDMATLLMTIKVIGYDTDDNERVVVDVPYQLDVLREIPASELEQIIEAHFSGDQRLAKP